MQRINFTVNTIIIEEIIESLKDFSQGSKRVL